MRGLARHLSFSNVVAVAALFIAIGGGAYAAGIGKNSVGTREIKDRSIKDIDVKPNSLTGRSILESSLSGVDAALLSGHKASDFLPAGAPVPDSEKLGGKLPSQYLGSDAQAVDSAKLGGQPPSAYLGSDAQAVDSAKLGGQSASEYLRGRTVAFTSLRSSDSVFEGPIVGGSRFAYTCTTNRMRMRVKNLTGTPGLFTASYLHGATATPMLSVVPLGVSEDKQWLDTSDNAGGIGNEAGSGTFVWTNGATVASGEFSYFADADHCEFSATMITGN